MADRKSCAVGDRLMTRMLPVLLLVGGFCSVPCAQAADTNQKATETPRTAKAAAPFDPTGYWVAMITEDWRYRMITPGKGEYAGIPINIAAKKVADAWDPAEDEAAGEQCKSYGAGALMRVPARLRISWAGADVLKVEVDNGKQTRLLYFAGTDESTAGSNAERTWQGVSQATWDDDSLKVKTQQLRAGYIRKNGVPYSEQAQLTEYWDFYKHNNGDQWLVIMSVLEDPVYLQEPYLFSPNFKKEPDGSKWNPQPCSAR